MTLNEIDPRRVYENMWKCGELNYRLYFSPSVRGQKIKVNPSVLRTSIVW